MSGRRSAALPAAISGAAVLLAAAAWFLRGEVPATPQPPAEDPAAAPAAAPDVPPAPPPTAASTPGSPQPPTAGVLPPKVPPGAKPYAVLRLVDSSTRETVRWRPYAFILVVPPTKSGISFGEHIVPAEDGRVRVHAVCGEGYEPPGIVTADEIRRARYRLAIPGYRAVEFASRAELEGEREVLLNPSPVSVRGRLTPGRGVDGGTVWCQILPAEPGAAPVKFPLPAPVPPAAFGPFAVHDLPDGKWLLTARAQAADGTYAIASREFVIEGRTADLGEIVLRSPVSLRARVVAKDGTPVLDPGLRVDRGPDRAEGTPEQDGWVRFRGLEPGTEVRVSSSLPDLAQEIRLPAEGGEEVRLELRWEEEGVRCRLRFTVGGLPPTRWGEVFEGPTLDKGAWKKDGFLEHDMAPGEYLFGIWAEPSGKSGMQRVWARFTVPRQPAWEADIACSEEQPR